MKQIRLLIASLLVFLCISAGNAFSDEGKYKINQVLGVVDGDTIDVQLDLGFDIYFNTRVRLNGINTPESRTTDIREKELGLLAKKFTSDWTANASSLTLVVEKKEKFGRELGRIYNENNECLNDVLIEEKLAVEYHGEKRNGWFNDLPTETIKE